MTLLFYMRIVLQKSAQKCESNWLLPIPLFVWTNNLFSWSTGKKIETFNDFDSMATKTHFESLILTDVDTNTIIQYNLRYTQEFGDGYLDD